MILIGLENSKRNILIDDSFNDGQQTDDIAIMLEAWGIKEVGWLHQCRYSRRGGSSYLRLPKRLHYPKRLQEQSCR